MGKEDQGGTTGELGDDITLHDTEQDDEAGKDAAAESGKDDGEDGDSQADDDDASGQDSESDEPEFDLDSVYRAEIDQISAEAEHWKKAHDKLAGKHGREIKRLRQQIEALERGKVKRGARRDYDDQDIDDDDDVDDVDVRRSGSDGVDRLAELEERRQLRESQRECAGVFDSTVRAFEAKFPKLTAETVRGVARFIQEHKPEVARAIATGDPDVVQRTTDRLLLTGLREVYAGRRAQSKQNTTERKRAAGSVGSGGAGQPGRGGRSAASTSGGREPTVDEAIAHFKRTGRRGF